jgi:glycyl-tRNA synthetase beta chain
VNPAAKHLGSMATFLLEVGTEELPAGFVADALIQWQEKIPKSLAEHSLSVGAVEVYGTPRRLAVLIRDLPLQQPDQTEEIKGPPAKAAFQDGKPTKAAIGFAQKQGVDLADFEIRPTEKGEFVFVQKTLLGQPTAQLLPDLAMQWITSLEGKRFMRWGDGDLRFSRPIRWLVALLDDAVLPMTLTNGSETHISDRRSWGHRVLHPAPIEIAHAGDYLTAMQSIFVTVDPQQRQTQIQTQAVQVAQQAGGVAVIDPDLLQEVIHLVEYPTAVVGQFDVDFLALPSEVIITEMESHQRYFPVLKSEGSSELLPYFITIANGDPAKADIIAEGNQRVIRARLSDGKFFFDADRAQPLESYLPRLETVTFQEDLGSVRQKVDRICQIADRVAEQLQLSQDDRAQVQRAALLSKADLVTQMVGEFPELQGVMGQKYALASGETAGVATAIVEHYLPKGAEDNLPVTLMGQVVGIADRLDTLSGIFGLGMVPTGSSDPFALRRAANAIVHIIWAANLSQLNLSQLLEQAIAPLAQSHTKVLKLSPAELLQQLQDFFLQRIRTLLLDDEGIDYDLVNAVLGENDPDYSQRALENLPDVRNRAQFLQAIREDGRLATIYETVNRASRLAAQGNLDTTQLNPAEVVQPARFQKASEPAFYEALVQLHQQEQTHQDYTALVAALSKIAPTVNAFFDGADSVLVMDPNADIKRNRLNLLGILRNHARVLADFGAIVKG